MPFYPTYEEWKRAFKISIASFISLFILPMRNGNIFTTNILENFFKPFYPTYEEWKQRVNRAKMVVEQLFILPMRNGNYAIFK